KIRRGEAMKRTRREVVAGLGAAGLVAAAPAFVGRAQAQSKTCPFRVAVINDEISDDLEHACKVASQDFGLSWIEIRSMWGKALPDLNQKQLDDAKSIL